VRVDHRGLDVLAAEKLLDAPDVIAVFEEMGREMSQGVTAGGLRHAGGPERVLEGALGDERVEMVPPASR
jgi:hypothetical protein